MVFELREALRRLCVEIGWSYAVFWSLIDSPGPKHLVWHDGYWCGKPQLSVLNDAVAHGNSFAVLQAQGEGSIDELVNKTMVPQVHVLGDGIVGVAAVSGNYQWILRELYGDQETMAEDLAFLNNQFSAGIQTIVVIPVPPHGAIQLGSTKRVMENIHFVIHARNSFMQLALESGSNFFGGVEKAIGKKSLSRPFSSSAISDYLFRLDCSNVNRSLSMKCNHQLISSTSKLSSQTSSLQLMEDLSKIDPQLLSMKKNLNSALMPFSETCQPMFNQREPSLIHLNNRFIREFVEAKNVSNLELSNSQNEMQLSSGCSSFMEKSLPYHHGSRSQESAIGIKALSDVHTGAHSLLPIVKSLESTNCLERLNSSSACSNENTRSLVDVSTMNSALKIEAYASSNLGLPDGFQVNKSSINKSQVLACSGNVKSEKDSLQSHGNSSNSSYGLPVGCFDECRFSNSNTVVANQGIEKVNCFGNCTSSYGKVHSINGDNDPGLVLMSNEQPSSFPLANFGDDLFEALGLYGSLAGREVSEQLFSEDVSDCNAQLNHSSKFYSANDDMSCTEIFSDPNADQLLDAVVSKIKANTGQSLDENMSCKTSVTRVSDTSLYRGSPSNDGSASSGKKRRENISPVLNSNSEAAGSSSVWSADSMDETGRSEFHKSQMSLWVESGQAMKSDSLFSSHGKRVDDICKVNRKRPRAGETPRPRPKDRQLIMDRVKELREIVPNGAKCSIDALLEKTIKHMLFLQSVTKHADRLKEIGEPKIISKDGGVLLKDNIQGGATWAFDVGSQPVSCPIIVEDLNPPREMLVEMLCEERGMFLEIADLIRGLGLTILKGVMEAHKDKIWARFAVEANRDVTRMEIFLSLVRLLEPTISDAATLHSLYNSNIHRNYFNAPVLPATGMSDPLQ